MKVNRLFVFGGLACLGVIVAITSLRAGETTPDWAMNGTIIEACSCPMFCTCYFNPNPAGHHGAAGEEHFCRFNNVIKVNSGHYGETDLAGAKVWIGGDLGSDFSQGKFDWAEASFDPSVTPAQREGIATVLAHLYPVEWGSFAVVEDGSIEWKADSARAEARLAGGKRGEVILNAMPGTHEGPVVIKNLRYWGAPRHDGFVLMPNEIEAYRSGSKPFEFKNSNGFMITFDINSKDIAAQVASIQ